MRRDFFKTGSGRRPACRRGRHPAARTRGPSFPRRSILQCRQAFRAFCPPGVRLRSAGARLVQAASKPQATPGGTRRLYGRRGRPPLLSQATRRVFDPALTRPTLDARRSAKAGSGAVRRDFPAQIPRISQPGAAKNPSPREPQRGDQCKASGWEVFCAFIASLWLKYGQKNLRR